MLKGIQNIGWKYADDMLILGVKIFKMKSYSVEFNSKNVLSRVCDSYSLFGNTLQLKKTVNFMALFYGWKFIWYRNQSLICKEDQLTGFYMTPVLTERSFQTDIKSYILCWFNKNY